MTVEPEITDFLKSQPDGVICSFSMGKDSLACMHYLQANEIPFCPFYFYHCPELKFIEEAICRYEEMFGIAIVQLPHPMLFDAFRHQDFQPHGRALMLSDYRFPKYDFTRLIDKYFDSIDLVERPRFTVTGMRASESFNRRMYFKKYGPINKTARKVAPIYNWSQKETLQYLRTNDIPLPKDYDIWSRSWDGLKYQFTYAMKDNFPDDWETLCEYFPLLPLEIQRYDFNQKYVGR